MIDFSNILSKIPAYERYLSVDELNHSSEALANEHPKFVSLLRLGKTRGGNEIIGLKVGDGKHNALIYGFPNPEEPLGGLLLEYFSSALTADEEFLREMDYTWYIIKCVDPDGAKLNEGYLKGSYTPYNFALNFYRTPPFATGEENFPYRYGDLLDLNNPTAETLALMKIMNGRDFHFISSLHNMKFGGMTFQVSEPCPLLYAPFLQLAKVSGIFTRKRAGFMLAPGVQLAGYFTPATNYVKLKAAGMSPLQNITGAYALEYVRLTNPHVFMMVPECTTWYDPRCYDDSPTDSTLGQVLEYESTVAKETNKIVVDTYQAVRSLLTATSPFKEMIEDVIDKIVHPKINVLDPDPELSPNELQKQTTIGQKVATEGRADVYRMFIVGASIRMVEHQIQAEGSNAKLKSAKDELQTKLEEYNDTVKSKYDCRHFPLRNLIAMNLGAILCSAEYAKNKSYWYQIWH